jgi:hypothetical protein
MCYPDLVRLREGLAPAKEMESMTDYEAIDAWHSQQYWAGQAAHYAAVEKAEQEIMALKGQTVTVTKGRKVPFGTTGEVFWVGRNSWGWRIGMKDAEGETHWTDVNNVETAEELAAKEVAV